MGQITGPREAAHYADHPAVAGHTSSKTCSGCGTIKTDLTLADRVYECGSCGLVLDRDLNAAVNLARYQSVEDKTAPPPTTAAA